MDEPARQPTTRHRIEVKLSEAEKTLIEEAARAKGDGISAFVRSAALEAARSTLGENDSETAERRLQNPKSM
jgi:uncharacterized protein (DUF1778 family)